MNDHQPLLTMVNPCEPIHHPDPPGPLNGQAPLLQQAIGGVVLNLALESGGKWGKSSWNMLEPKWDPDSCELFGVDSKQQITLC